MPHRIVENLTELAGKARTGRRAARCRRYGIDAVWRFCRGPGAQARASIRAVQRPRGAHRSVRRWRYGTAIWRKRSRLFAAAWYVL